jgi:integrase
VDVEPESIQKLKDISLTYTDKRFPLFVALLIDTGARKSELLERTWADVDLEKRRILLATSKNGKPRALFFSEPTAQLIRRLAPRRPDADLLFAGRDHATPINFRASWVSLTKAAGIPDCHMHDIRHCRAKELLLNGTPIAVAAQIMGHGVQVLERRYGTLAVDDKQDAAELTWRVAA